MRMAGTRYGVLSTYTATVFVRRVADYSFQVSQPILIADTSPTLREAFFIFARWAETADLYQEAPGFNPVLLSQTVGTVASTRPSRYRHGYAQSDTSNSTSARDQAITQTSGSNQFVLSNQVYSISAKSIFLDIGKVVCVEAELLVKGSAGSSTKQTWKGKFADREVAIKYWPPSQYERYCAQPPYYTRGRGVVIRRIRRRSLKSVSDYFIP